MFGCFFIKKNDNIAEIVKALNEFYASTGATIVKKRKAAPKNKGEIGGKKSKQAIKANKIDDDDEIIGCVNSPNCKSLKNIEINNTALIELCYYYEMSKLSLDDCIFCYHDNINHNLNSDDRTDFPTLLHDPVKLKTIEEYLIQIINKK